MAQISGASLSPIYNRLNDAPSYHPLDAETFADWSLEAGDIVTVSRDGKNYTSPVYASTVNWRKRQQVTISSTGQEKRTSVTKMSQRKFSGGRSGLVNTQRTYELIETSYNEMRSGLELTSSTAKLYVENAYTQMKSGLELTSSSAKLYVNDAYNRMNSGLQLTSSSAYMWVRNSYTQMQSGLALTSSSARLYAKQYTDGKTTKAEIIARINESGTSEALISAERISLSGNTTLSGSLSVITGGIATSGNIQAGLLGGSYIRGSSLKLIASSGSQGATEYTMTGFDLGTTVKNAELDSGSLKLTKYNGEVITFSRAISSWTWGGGNGKVNVTALPQNQTKSVNISIDGTSSITSNGTYTYTADYENSDGDDMSTGATKTVTVSVHPNKYTFSVSRTQDQTGYHYTLSIGTGSQTPFPSSGTVDMWK